MNFHRRRPPHLQVEGTPQFVTFCLADAWEGRWNSQLQHLPEELRLVAANRLLDERPYGECLLGRAEIAVVVAEALAWRAGQQYALHAYTIMPNHVHLLITPNSGFRLGRILQQLKSYTALEIHRALGRQGSLWQADYWDRYIRDGEHFERAMNYIQMNPVKGGLAEGPECWPWTWWEGKDQAVPSTTRRS